MDKKGRAWYTGKAENKETRRHTGWDGYEKEKKKEPLEKAAVPCGCGRQRGAAGPGPLYGLSLIHIFTDGGLAAEGGME